jgi:hypothetical protein
MPNTSIKSEKTYKELRKKGGSKEKSARIANASAASGKSKVAAKGGKSPSYDAWTVDKLRKKAAEVGIKGRSSMSKAQLVSALRNH